MWKFIKSSINSETWITDHKKEVSFIGRSNVGKSSLLNALTNVKKLARVSNTPGRTKMINFFQNNQQILVDLPGYGYAKMSQQDKRIIENMLQNYFEHRELEIKVFVLIDIKIGLTTSDYMMIQYLQNLGRNFIIVGTKFDKAKQSEIIKTKNQLKSVTSNYLFTSAKTKYNIDKLNESLQQFFSS